MAKLSDLLSYKEKLYSINLNGPREADETMLLGLKEVINEIDTLSITMLHPLRQQMNHKQEAINKFLDDLEQHLGQRIKPLQESYARKSIEMHKNYTKHDYAQRTAFQKVSYTDSIEFKKYVSYRTGIMNSWQKTGLIFGASNVEQIVDMFTCYPIYVIDDFAEAYQLDLKFIPVEQGRKIRFYQKNNLQDFPKQAMGSIVGCNYFTFAEQSLMMKDLEWLEKQMVPGAVMGFNFNDCELSKCAKLFESGMRTFVLGSKIREKLESLGLKIKHWEYLPEEMTVWVEALKPGTFKSIKKAETLGRFIDKSFI